MRRAVIGVCLAIAISVGAIPWGQGEGNIKEGIIKNIATGKTYTTIQAAIDDPDTVDGHTIVVGPGNYTENVVVRKELVIKSSEGPKNTIVKTNTKAPKLRPVVFDVLSDNVTIEGFTILGVAREGTGGIRLRSMGIRLRSDHCTISNNICNENELGIYLYSSNNNVLTNNIANDNKEYGVYLWDSSDNNTLMNNTANNNELGIFLVDSSGNTLTNNTANNNKEEGISLFDSSDNNTLTNNTANNNKGYGIFLGLSSDNNTLMNNTANNNKVGIALCDSSGNTLMNNTANNNGKSDIYLYHSSDNVLKGNNAPIIRRE